MNPLRLLRRPEDEESTMAAPDLSDITIDENSPNSEYWQGEDSTPDAPYLNELDEQNAMPDLESLPDTSALADSPVHNELMEHLKNVPEQEKTGFWRKLAAGLTGAAVGLGQGASAGIQTARGIIDDPFNKAVNRWKLRGQALQTASADEGRRAGLLSRMSEGVERRNLSREQNSMNLLKGLSAQRGMDSRSDSARKAAEGRLATSQAGQDRRHAEDLAARTADREQREGASSRTDQRLRELADTKSRNRKLTAADKKTRRENVVAKLATDPRFSKFYEDPDGEVVGGESWPYNKVNPGRKKLNVDAKGKPAVNFDAMSPSDFQEYSDAIQEELDRLEEEDSQ